MYYALVYGPDKADSPILLQEKNILRNGKAALKVDTPHKEYRIFAGAIKIKDHGSSYRE
jgi:hypothetical protein